MKFADKFKQLISIDNGYFEDVDPEEIDAYSNNEPSRRQTAGILRPEKREVSVPVSGSTKVVDIHTTAKLQVVLKKPEHFDEATAIADELLEKRTVVLNLEFTAKDEAGKLLCFLSGVAYANGGKLKKIANNTYIITPYNVDVMGDLLDELENNGMFFV